MAVLQPGVPPSSPAVHGLSRYNRADDRSDPCRHGFLRHRPTQATASVIRSGCTGQFVGCGIFWDLFPTALYRNFNSADFYFFPLNLFSPMRAWEKDPRRSHIPLQRPCWWQFRALEAALYWGAAVRALPGRLPDFNADAPAVHSVVFDDVCVGWTGRAADAGRHRCRSVPTAVVPQRFDRHRLPSGRPCRFSARRLIHSDRVPLTGSAGPSTPVSGIARPASVWLVSGSTPPPVPEDEPKRGHGDIRGHCSYCSIWRN